MTGSYRAVARNGGKIDCSADNERNIKEIKEIKNGYLISYYRYCNAQGGEAQITLQDGKLTFIKKNKNSLERL